MSGSHAISGAYPDQSFDCNIIGEPAKNILITNINSKPCAGYTAVCGDNIAEVVRFFRTDHAKLKVTVSTTKEYALKTIDACVDNKVDLLFIDNQKFELKKKDGFSKTLLSLKFVGGDLFEGKLMKAVKAAARLIIPSKLSKEKALGKLQEAVDKHSADRDDDCEALLETALSAFTRKVLAVRCFADYADTLTVDSLDAFSRMLKEDKQRLFVVRAPMGSGKTKLAMSYIEEMIEKNSRTLYVTHRRSIAQAASFRVPSLRDYQSLAAGLEAECPAISMCVNSLIKDRFASLLNFVNVTVVDEVSQVLRHISSGTVKNTEKEPVYKKLSSVVAASHSVVLIDADCNDQVIEFAKKSAGDKEVVVIDMQQADCGLTVSVDNFKRVHDASIAAANSGEKVLIACDNKKKAIGLEQLIKKGNPRARVLMLHAQNIRDAAQASFINNPTKQCSRYDVVIYTPVISASASIEADHFEKHFGLFTGSVMPTDFIQMLRRDRTATSFLVGVDRQQAFRSEFTAKSETEFEKMSGKLIEQEAFVRNNAEQSLWILLESCGINVRKNDTEIEEIEGSIKEASKLEDAYYRAGVTAAGTVHIGSDSEETTEDEYFYIEKLAVRKWTSSGINDAAFDLWNRGTLKQEIKNLEVVLSNIKTMKAADETEKQAKVGVHDRASFARKFVVFNKILTAAGVNVQAEQARREIISGATDKADELSKAKEKEKEEIKRNAENLAWSLGKDRDEEKAKIISDAAILAAKLDEACDKKITKIISDATVAVDKMQRTITVTDSAASKAMKICESNRTFLNSLGLGISFSKDCHKKAYPVKTIKKLLARFGIDLDRIGAGSGSYYVSAGRFEEVMVLVSDRKKRGECTIDNYLKILPANK